MQQFMEQLEGRRLFANPHFQGDVDYSVQGTALNASGTIAGIGNQNLTVTLTAEGTATFTSFNPSGKPNPGHSGSFEVSGSQTISRPKNGSTDFDVTTASVATPAPKKPNPKWVQVTDVNFTSAQLTVTQGGSVVLTDSQTF